MKHITKTHHGIGWVKLPENVKQYYKDVLDYACRSYSYMMELKQELTFSEFASLIENRFDTTEPRNQEVVRVLRIVDSFLSESC